VRLELPLCLIFLFFAACGREEAPQLDVHQILDKSGDAVKARLGEPEIDFTRSEKVTTLQWRNIDGDSTWVYIDLIYDNASYVTYTFKKMDPFDMAEALRRVGLTLPEEEPERTWENGSMRWQPFDPYHRLVVNPVTKAVTVSLDFDEVSERETTEE
jgi:hypothetical protein|tara:strand:- start:682 stop:1152 length:471 start_codon:yes stop_codon:yes gene_type:complete